MRRKITMWALIDDSNNIRNVHKSEKDAEQCRADYALHKPYLSLEIIQVDHTGYQPELSLEERVYRLERLQIGIRR